MLGATKKFYILNLEVDLFETVAVVMAPYPCSISFIFSSRANLSLIVGHRGLRYKLSYFVIISRVRSILIKVAP